MNKQLYSKNVVQNYYLYIHVKQEQGVNRNLESSFRMYWVINEIGNIVYE